MTKSDKKMIKQIMGACLILFIYLAIGAFIGNAYGFWLEGVCVTLVLLIVFAILAIGTYLLFH